MLLAVIIFGELRDFILSKTEVLTIVFVYNTENTDICNLIEGEWNAIVSIPNEELYYIFKKEIFLLF